MATNNLNILFWLYKSKLNKQGEAPIYLRVTFNKDRKNISTGYNINPSRWDSSKGTVKGLKDDALQVNSYISQTKARLMELFNRMLDEGDVNLDNLIDKFFGRDTNAGKHSALPVSPYPFLLANT